MSNPISTSISNPTTQTPKISQRDVVAHMKRVRSFPFSQLLEVTRNCSDNVSKLLTDCAFVYVSILPSFDAHFRVKILSQFMENFVYNTHPTSDWYMAMNEVAV